MQEEIFIESESKSERIVPDAENAEQIDVDDGPVNLQAQPLPSAIMNKTKMIKSHHRQCITCGRNISVRRYHEHTSRCLIAGFTAVHSTTRKQYMYHCNRCDWKGRKERMNDHLRVHHKPLDLPDASSEKKLITVETASGLSVRLEEADQRDFSDIQNQQGPQMIRNDEFSDQTEKQDYYKKVQIVTIASLVRMFGKKNGEQWVQRISTVETNQIYTRINAAFPWISNVPFVSVRNMIVKKFVYPLMDQPGRSALSSFQFLLQEFQTKKQAIISPNIVTAAFKNRVTPSNVESKRSKRAAPGFDSQRKKLENLKQNRKQLLKKIQYRQTNKTEKQLDRLLRINKEKIQSVSRTLKRADSAFRRIVLFKYSDEATMKYRNDKARQEQALNYIFQRVTDVLNATAICADRVLFQKAEQFFDNVPWSFIGPGYFNMSQMSSWFPLTKRFLQRTRGLAFNQFKQVKSLFKATKVPDFGIQQFQNVYYKFLQENDLFHVQRLERDSQTTSNNLVYRDEQLWMDIHAPICPQLEELEQKWLEGAAPINFQSGLEIPEEEKIKKNKKTVNIDLIEEEEEHIIDANKWIQIECDVPSCTIQAINAFRPKPVQVGRLCFKCRKWIKNGYACRYFTMGIEQKCGAAFHEECVPEKCPFDEPVKTISFSSHIIRSSFIAGSVLTASGKTFKKTEIIRSRENWIAESNVQNAENYQIAYQYDQLAHFYPGFSTEGHVIAKFSPKDTQIMEEFEKSYPPFNVKIGKRGRGGFAARKISKGQIIAFYTGILTPLPKLYHMNKLQYIFNITYGPGQPFELAVYIPEGQIFGCGQFINTSNKKELNMVSAVIGYYKQQLYNVFYANKDIKQGQELLLDYNGQLSEFPTENLE